MKDKKRFNHYMLIEDFKFLDDKKHEVKLDSVAQLIAKMIEFCRKNWKEFVKEL